VGEDPSRSGLIETPIRAAKAFVKFTEGYAMSVEEVVGQGIFDEVVSSEPITVKDIDIYSLCEHHLVPFFGKVHITYVPNKKILGLSKLPRIADVFARRLQVTCACRSSSLKLINVCSCKKD
jgi:GTP cyclohydrolase IA